MDHILLLVLISIGALIFARGRTQTPPVVMIQLSEADAPPASGCGSILLIALVLLVVLGMVLPT